MNDLKFDDFDRAVIVLETKLRAAEIRPSYLFVSTDIYIALSRQIISGYIPFHYDCFFMNLAYSTVELRADPYLQGCDFYFGVKNENNDK